MLEPLRTAHSPGWKATNLQTRTRWTASHHSFTGFNCGNMLLPLTQV